MHSCSCTRVQVQSYAVMPLYVCTLVLALVRNRGTLFNHALVLLYLHNCTHLCSCTVMQSCACTLVHAPLHTLVQLCPCALVLAQLHTLMHACFRACTILCSCSIMHLCGCTLVLLCVCAKTGKVGKAQKRSLPYLPI